MIVSIPKVEEHMLRNEDTTVKSTVEEKFQLQVPAGSFEDDTKVSLKVFILSIVNNKIYIIMCANSLWRLTVFIIDFCGQARLSGRLSVRPSSSMR